MPLRHMFCSTIWLFIFNCMMHLNNWNWFMNLVQFIISAKEDEDPTLPPDDCGKSNYTPLQIKIKPVENVWLNTFNTNVNLWYKIVTVIIMSTKKMFVNTLKQHNKCFLCSFNVYV